MNAIPYVSDIAPLRIYDVRMAKTSRKSKATAWATALDAHVKASKTVTWAKIAGGMDMTEGGIRHWRNGTREIKLTEFLSLCRHAGADPATILHGVYHVQVSEDLLPAKEQIMLHLFRGLFLLQQQRLVTGLRALFDANQITRKELGQKPLNGVSDEQVRAAYGDIPLPRHVGRKINKPKRELGDAMGDFLGDNE